MIRRTVLFSDLQGREGCENINLNTRMYAAETAKVVVQNPKGKKGLDKALKVVKGEVSDAKIIEPSKASINRARYKAAGVSVKPSAAKTVAKEGLKLAPKEVVSAKKVIEDAAKRYPKEGFIKKAIGAVKNNPKMAAGVGAAALAGGGLLALKNRNKE